MINYPADRLATFIHKAVISELLKMDVSVKEVNKGQYLVCKDFFEFPVPLSGVQLQKLCLDLEQLQKDPLMKRYHFYFLNGSYYSAVSSCVSKAATKCGIGGGAIAAIDFYSEGIFPTANYNPFLKKWVFIDQAASSQMCA